MTKRRKKPETVADFLNETVEERENEIKASRKEPNRVIVLTEEEEKEERKKMQEITDCLDMKIANTYCKAIKAGITASGKADNVKQADKNFSIAMKSLDAQANFPKRCDKRLTTSLRINRIMKVALDELGFCFWINKKGGNVNKLSQSEWFIVALVELAKGALKGEINPLALETNNINRILMLYVLWSRAKRKAKGYSFSSEDKRTRLPLGPTNEI